MIKSSITPSVDLPERKCSHISQIVAGCTMYFPLLHCVIGLKIESFSQFFEAIFQKNCEIEILQAFSDAKWCLWRLFYLKYAFKKSSNCTVKVLFCCLTNFSCIIHSLWSRSETFKGIFVHCIPRKSHRYGFPPTFPQNGYCYIWSEKRLTFPVHLLMHISCVK